MLCPKCGANVGDKISLCTKCQADQPKRMEQSTAQVPPQHRNLPGDGAACREQPPTESADAEKDAESSEALVDPAHSSSAAEPLPEDLYEHSERSALLHPFVVVLAILFSITAVAAVIAVTQFMESGGERDLVDQLQTLTTQVQQQRLFLEQEKAKASVPVPAMPGPADFQRGLSYQEMRKQQKSFDPNRWSRLDPEPAAASSPALGAKKPQD